MKIVNDTKQSISYTTSFANGGDCGDIPPEGQATFEYDNYTDVSITVTIQKVVPRMAMTISQP